MSGDRRNHQPALPTHIEMRPERSDIVRRLHRSTIITARREAGRLPGRIDTPHLRRHRGEPGHAQHQNHGQRGDGECRLDGGRAAITGQTLVFSARLMMFVRAVTIESPVTTV